MSDAAERPRPPEPEDASPPDLEPARPEEEGVPDKRPDAMQIEAARLLAAKARELLHEQGFDDEQIHAWATTYTAEFGSGDVDRFLAWIATEQQR